MAGLARRLAPAAALGGLAVIIVGVADPVLAGRTDATATGDAASGRSLQSAAQAPGGADAQAQEQPPADTQPDESAADSCATGGQQVTGGAAMTPWGPVQVSATVAGRQVCSVQALAWPDNDRKSQMINSYAIPQLDAMATQSPMQFDYVSGATYTSQGYHDSLQSILDAM